MPSWFGKVWGVIASTVTLAGCIVVGIPVTTTVIITGTVVAASIVANSEKDLPVEKNKE